MSFVGSHTPKTEDTDALEGTNNCSTTKYKVCRKSKTKNACFNIYRKLWKLIKITSSSAIAVTELIIFSQRKKSGHNLRC